MKYGKKYFEYLAKVILTKTYDSSLSKLIDSESPDWIMSDMSIGLEVTRAIPRSWAETDSLINEYFGKGLDGQYIKNEIEKRCKRGFNGRIDVFDGKAVYSPVKDVTYDFSIYSYQINNRVIEKLNILPIYQKCKQQWLFVFAETSMLDEEDIKNTINKIDFSNYSLSFDKIFIYTVDKLFVFDMKNIYAIDIEDCNLKKQL